MISGTASHEEMMMRYKRPRPVVPSTKKPLFVSNTGYPGYAFPASDAILNDSSSKNTIPPSVPHRVVVGFDISGATDNSPSDFDVAESPRSVLDRSVLRSSVFRSPQSSLGSSLSRRLDSHPRVTSSVRSPTIENANAQEERVGHHQAVQKLQDFRIQPMQICTPMKLPQEKHQETVAKENMKDSKSIFFTGSPVQYPMMLSTDFLSRCCFCKSSLRGKDIFMYRGDQAFCSVECRYQKIVIDESKERETVTGTAAAYFPPAATVHYHKF